MIHHQIETEILDESTMLQTVLDRQQWIIARAASELGLSRQALYRRIEKYQLTPKGSE